MPKLNFPHFIYGGDYNPDQWPEDIWLEDVRLMREAGVNLVSLGIFSWSKLEPRQDEFDFDWLDRLMDLLNENGVSVNLATPTASPPAWLVHRYPESLPVTVDGITLWHGGRRHYCPHSSAYLERADIIASKLAERYAGHPALALWHVDNEYANGVTACFCDASIAAFRDWLRNKYDSIDALNHAWGTAFWSQHYNEWEEIQPPRRSPAQPNPTQQLDWARFNSDSWIECFTRQKTILKKFAPDVPVTTNFMGFHKPTDYWKFASSEDVVSNDNYPDMYDPEWMVRAAMVCDLMRSLGNRAPWLLMEQATSNVNWRQKNAVKRPGEMRICSYQAVARGADGVMFFQWRASKAGAEKHHSGMVPHIGTDSRVWREVKAFGNELSKLDAVLSSQVQADVAILLDWESWWALEQDSKPSNDLKLMNQIYSYYKPLYERNITADFVHPRADLSRYKLVIAPTLYLVTDSSASNINEYVEKGGNLVMSLFSGMVDENEHIRLGGYPAPFRDMLGFVIEEYVPYSELESNTIRTSDDNSFQCSFWSDVIHLIGAGAIATYEQDYFAGSPAVTRNKFGNGTAYYVSTVPDAKGMDWLMEYVCINSGVKPVASNLPPAVELVQRTDGTQVWLFALNYSKEKVIIPLNQPGREMLGGAEAGPHLSLAPMDVSIVHFPVSRDTK